MYISMWIAVTAALVPALALAQPDPEATQPSPALPADVASGPKVTVGGYLEAYYQAHLQHPSNGLANLRGFDSRSRTFTLSNVALDVKGEAGALTARIVVQVGHAPSTYYLAETASPGAGGVNASSSELWKYLQAATITAKLPEQWVLEAGLFPSPIGPELIPVKDNINWSRSNLFFGLPFYHTGVALAHPLGGGWTGKLHVAEDGGMTAGAIFWPTRWMASGTATLAYQPVSNVSVRLEVRHDQADSDVFFGGEVAIDPMTTSFVPNRDVQDTATVGVTAWF